MRKPIAAGNWKMNFGPRQAWQFAQLLREPLSQVVGAEVILFPPFISIPTVHQALQSSPIQLGAQNVSDQPGGAYTGEIAANMIAELCQWVIIGHSERRGYYGETDEFVNRKTIMALHAGLRPIVCVGERLEEHEANLTERVITAQVRRSLADLPVEHLDRLVVAYEPIWAIGTGRAATQQDATAVIAIIRALVSERYGQPVADAVRILYGGSVTAANISEFMASPDVDGALVGGASLKPEFADIAHTIAAARVR